MKSEVRSHIFLIIDLTCSDLSFVISYISRLVRIVAMIVVISGADRDFVKVLHIETSFTRLVSVNKSN